MTDTGKDSKAGGHPGATVKEQGRETNPKLLEILVCPLTKTTLRYDRKRQELISEAAGLAFPIREGIPIMVVDEARQLSDDERHD